MTEANNQGIDTPFVRPKHLSEDDTPSLLVIEHSVEWAIQNNYCKPDIIVVLQPTSPLRMSNHIDEAVQLLINDKEADSIVSVTDVPHNYSPESVMIINNGYLKSFIKQNEMLNMRQLKSNFLARNGAAIYAFRTNCLLEKNSIYGEKIIPYRMDQKHSIDIDTPFDLLLCDMLLKNKNKIKD
jgi:CMP-N-acetylneuraminic acid synthetase